MPIHVPGVRNRKNRITGSKRNIVAVLQLTAMVDMFTVLVVFLLQNYASTNQILPISDRVALPKATSTAQLTPSLVVTFSKEVLRFNGKDLASFDEIKRNQDWVIESLKAEVIESVTRLKSEKKKDLVVTRKQGGMKIFSYEKMTLQADKDIDMLSIKKVMFTLTEAGIKEINFAVIQIKKYPT